MIDSFTGEYEFLSNFYPVRVSNWGVVYPSVEHAYQAAKTRPEEQELREKIAKLPTAAAAKKVGRKLALRSDWEEVKIPIMRYLLHQKFLGGELEERLLATGDEELVEGNWWGDTFWGVCRGVGENHLGKLLMEVRSGLRKEK